MSIPVAWRGLTIPKIPFINTVSGPSIATRSFSSIPHLAASQRNTQKNAKEKEKQRRKKKKHVSFKQYDLKDMQQFALCDAIRYIKAFEVGRDPKVPKYDLAIKLKTRRDGPVVRNTIKLPHAVKTDVKIAVICPPDSRAAKEAKAAGAEYIGEEVIFEMVKQGKIDFDRCLAHPDSLAKIGKEGLGRILGPRGLMPSAKLGTVSDKIGPLISNMLGGSMYRERQGVIRMAVGQLAFTPEQLRDNIRTLVDQIKAEVIRVGGDNFPKSVYEIVLSSTHSPGFSLTGEFKSEHSPPSAVLSAA